MVVEVSWLRAWFSHANQTLDQLHQAFGVLQIKHEPSSALGLEVAGLGLAHGLDHPCALLQTGP